MQDHTETETETETKPRVHTPAQLLAAARAEEVAARKQVVDLRLLAAAKANEIATLYRAGSTWAGAAQIDSLRSLAEQIDTARRAEEKAALWINRLLAMESGTAS